MFIFDQLQDMGRVIMGQARSCNELSPSLHVAPDSPRHTKFRLTIFNLGLFILSAKGAEKEIFEML